MQRALEKILTKTGFPELVDTLAQRLSNGELTTLLLEVYRCRNQQLRPHELFNNLTDNRFIQSAETNPIALRKAEAEFLSLAQHAGFKPIELSPLAPLGASAVYGKVSQNNVLSALRGCEVVSDPTTLMLPLMTREVCDKRSPLSELHWAASQRVVRTNLMQVPDFKPHFALFAACSLVRSENTDTLLDTALNHLRLQREIYTACGIDNFELRIRAKGRKKYLADALVERLNQSREFNHVLESASGTDYYEGFQIKTLVKVQTANQLETLELADCGFVDWAAQLKGHKNLHSFISGIGLERLLDCSGVPALNKPSSKGELAR